MFRSLGLFIYLKEINTFIYQRQIQLIKIVSKDIYNVKKVLYF